MSKTGLFGFPLEENYNENVEEKDEESSSSEEEPEQEKKEETSSSEEEEEMDDDEPYQNHGSHYVKKSGKIWKNPT